MSQWKKERSPDEVPTPVAIALAEYCRRSGVHTENSAVREALSFLPEAADARVTEIVESASAPAQLGPFALVDVARGTLPAVAAAREACGYYEVVRTVGALPTPDERPAPKSRRRSSEAKKEPAAPKPAKRTGRKKRTVEPPAPAVTKPRDSLREIRRGVGAPRPPAPAAPPSIVPATPTVQRKESSPRTKRRSGLAQHETPPPRSAGQGRFTRLPSAKRPLAELFTPEGRERLEHLALQNQHRFGLRRGLERLYAAPKGQQIPLPEIERALRLHGRLPEFVKGERAAVLETLRSERGSLNRAASELALAPPELRELVRLLNLSEEVERIRDRFRREALATGELRRRLDLLSKERYLDDLKITRRFRETLAAELRELLEQVTDAPATGQTRVEALARLKGVSAERLARALTQLGLDAALQNRHT